MPFDSAEVFTFTGETSKYSVNWNDYTKSEFDDKCLTSWTQKMDQGCFRYGLNITKWKILEGSYKFLAQLNTDRATKRRDPVDVNSVQQPFDEKTFNFSLVKDEEVMFRVKNTYESDDKLDYIIINVSPLESGHSLLLPAVPECHPQVLTTHSLTLALLCMLNSHSPTYRVGFNGLCAYATVNHLHFHSYYLNFPMLLEYIEVEPLIKRCYQLLSYPAKGFVFQVTEDSDIGDVVRDLYTLTSYLSVNNAAHNLYMTRGVNCNNAREEGWSDDGLRDVVRVYVWARTSSCGAKDYQAFNPALAELFGHLVVKSEEAYENMTEDSAVEVLHEITNGIFEEIRDKILSHLFT